MRRQILTCLYLPLSLYEAHAKAATGQLAPQAFLLFAIIFFWTLPHSWALSVLIDADYERGGVPMLPVKFGTEMTRWQIVWYSLLLVILTLLPVPLGMLRLVYFVIAVLLGIGFLYRALRLLDVATKLSARQMYKLGVTQLKSLPHPLSIAWRGESAATLPPRYEVERGIEGVRFLCAHLELRNIYTLN